MVVLQLVSVAFASSVYRQQPPQYLHGDFLCVPVLWCLSFSWKETKACEHVTPFVRGACL